MNEVSELLNTHFQAFKDEASPYDFFPKLADYVRYVIETDKFAPILAELRKQQSEQYQKLDDYYDKAVKELGASKEKLVEIVNKNNLSSPSITEALKTIEALKNGTMHVSNPPKELSDCLFAIAKSIGQQGKIDLLKIFNNPKPIFHNIYGDFIFSTTLTDFNNHHEMVKELWDMEQWGALSHLTVLEAAISFYEPMENLLILLPKDGKPHWQKVEEGAEKIGLVMEWREIKNEAQNYPHQQGSNNHFSSIFAKIESFKQWATRLHNFLLKEVVKQSNLPDKKSKGKIKLFFSADDGLYREKNNKKISYPIRGKRAKLVKFLKNGKIKGSELVLQLDQPLYLVSKEIEEINTNFKAKLELADGLIIRLETGGYKLDNTKFLIQFLD